MTTHPAPPVRWQDWRACPVCRAKLGTACRSLSGRIVGGRPDGVAVELSTPHHARRQRTARRALAAALDHTADLLPALLVLALATGLTRLEVDITTADSVFFPKGGPPGHPALFFSLPESEPLSLTSPITQRYSPMRSEASGSVSARTGGGRRDGR
jgi:hypothetical protein